LRPGLARLGLTGLGIERRGGEAQRLHLADLIAHQGDQRRNDQGQAFAEQGRQLIA
jgi:hypothetical protein